MAWLNLALIYLFSITPFATSKALSIGIAALISLDKIRLNLAKELCKITLLINGILSIKASNLTLNLWLNL